MKFEAATIKDIAKALGLSTSTVSRALRDSYEIGPETKKLVLEYAEKIHYRPNPIALSLKEKRSRSIDGLLVSVSSETQDLGHLKNLHDRGLPIVFVDRVVDAIHTHKVTVDNFKGAYEATAHLISNGFRQIATLANSEYLSITKERLAGYKEALGKHNLRPEPGYVQHCLHGGLVYAEVEQALDNLFRLKKRPDAIFASSDKLTTNCLRYFKAKGFRIPCDAALIGFSNLDFPELLSPSLSVVRQPAFEMGQVSTNHLINLIESKRPVKDFDTTVLPPELFIRASSVKGHD